LHHFAFDWLSVEKVTKGLYWPLVARSIDKRSSIYACQRG
jgi:hypothetical protein